MCNNSYVATPISQKEYNELVGLIFGKPMTCIQRYNFGD